MKHKICALAFSAAALCSTGTAIAQDDAPIIRDGTHVIVVHKLHTDSPYTGGGDLAGCMIVSNLGRNAVPSLYSWGNDPGAWCGLSGYVDVVLQNAQAVWQVRSIHASNGKHAYVIKSHVNGRCLIRGRNGQASAPSLHLWTGLGGDDAYCGFRSADELIANGQAAWSFETSPFGWGVLARSAWTATNADHRLGFAAPRTWPNTDPAAGFANFSHGVNRWMFVFWPTDY